jgi:hypothetical protein
VVELGLAGETEVYEKIRHSATLSTTYTTWLDLGSNPSRRGWNPGNIV